MDYEIITITGGVLLGVLMFYGIYRLISSIWERTSAVARNTKEYLKNREDFELYKQDIEAWDEKKRRYIEKCSACGYRKENVEGGPEMTYKEAANIVDPYERGRALFKYNFFDRFEKQQEAYRIAAELLRKCGENAAEIKPDSNQPLTLEQLREMDGQPVWVQTPGVEKYGRWVIVAGVDTEGGQKTLYCQGDYTCRDYGKVWLAYAYPPAHIDRETWTAEWKDHYRSGIKVGSGFVCSSCDMWNGEQPDICPYCGRAMSEYGFSKLEKRLRGSGCGNQELHDNH